MSELTAAEEDFLDTVLLDYHYADKPIPAGVMAELDQIAAPWPGRWLLPSKPGDRKRVIELCAGPGGWAEGLKTVLGLTAYDVVGVDMSADACATAVAAGHVRICADITKLDPEHPALRETVGVIISPPCPSFSTAGKRAGLLRSNICILRDAIAAVGEAGGFIRLDEVCCDELYPDLEDDCPLCADFGYHEGYAPRNGQTWDDVRAMLDGLTDPRIGLMLEVVLWPLALQAAGAPIEWMVMEQSNNLPEEILEELSVEFGGADWFRTTWAILEAADLGVASRRKRAFMIASRYRWVTLEPPKEPLPTTTMAEALGWDEGERVNTRGQRPVDPATGRAKGGNTYSADKPSWCLTGKTRTWVRERDGLRLTPAEAGVLVSFRASYPWQGSRSSQFQQSGDVVCPAVAAYVLGVLHGVDWERRVRDYLTGLYHYDDLWTDEPWPEEYDLAV
ncbi:DNA cytosine methyltransferase [Streptomyces sp. NPDC004435]|uniref:DNA cytosine methyltransferase n=1 Tax=Streptomyces sp. NPDC004435 TaxID=3364701 RepID=UPI0036BF2A1C